MGRTPCCDNKEHNKKGAWSTDEDQRLINHINRHGPGNWRTLPQQAGLLRCGKSCRLRWINYLKPGLKRGNFSQQENALIIGLHRQLGNKWSSIAERLPGRTDNEIKNYWNSHIKRMLYDNGIDPSTHKPLKASNNKKKEKSKGIAMNNSATTASATSSVLSSSNNNASTTVIMNNTHCRYFNVSMNTKVSAESMNGAEESNSCSGVTVTTEEANYHPILNLDLSLAPPSSLPPQLPQHDSIASQMFNPNKPQLQSVAAAPNNTLYPFYGPKI